MTYLIRIGIDWIRYNVQSNCRERESLRKVQLIIGRGTLITYVMVI